MDCIPNNKRSFPIEYAMNNSYAFGGANSSIILRNSETIAKMEMSKMNIIGRGKVLSETISVESIRNNVEINGILEPENFDIKQYVKYKGLRSLTKATNLAIASISEAITDAGSRYSEHSPERIGVLWEVH